MPYETYVSREIDRILNRLERLQRMRKGQVDVMKHVIKGLASVRSKADALFCSSRVLRRSP